METTTKATAARRGALPRTLAQLEAAPWCAGLLRPYPAGSGALYVLEINPAWVPGHSRHGHPLTVHAATVAALLAQLKASAWAHIVAPAAEAPSTEATEAQGPAAEAPSTEAEPAARRVVTLTGTHPTTGEAVSRRTARRYVAALFWPSERTGGNWLGRWDLASAAVDRRIATGWGLRARVVLISDPRHTEAEAAEALRIGAPLVAALNARLAAAEQAQGWGPDAEATETEPAAFVAALQAQAVEVAEALSLSIEMAPRLEPAAPSAEAQGPEAEAIEAAEAWKVADQQAARAEAAEAYAAAAWRCADAADEYAGAADRRCAVAIGTLATTMAATLAGGWLVGAAVPLAAVLLNLKPGRIERAARALAPMVARVRCFAGRAKRRIIRAARLAAPALPVGGLG
jgi:hypothetical protein